MPKVRITFNLPEEQEEFDVAMNGGKYAAALGELDNWLREEAKYNNHCTLATDDVRGKLHNICADLSIEVNR